MSDETQAVAELTPETVPPPPTKGASALVAIGEKGLVLKSMEELLRFAQLAVSSGAAPKGMTAGAAAMAIQAGLERGLGLLGGLQHCVVINGVLSWRGQGAVALIQNSPACRPGSLRFWPEGTGEDTKGVAVAWRSGYAQPDRREFSVKDARQAHLWGKQGPWTEYPGRQLAWRALGFLARDIFPDVLGGFPMAEEAQDFEPAGVEVTHFKSGSREMLPPPSSPDPLMATLGLESKPVEFAKASDTEITLEEEKAAPFPSHKEADKAIADAEGQRRLKL